jgi:hypothetical protein
MHGHGLLWVSFADHHDGGGTHNHDDLLSTNLNDPDQPYTIIKIQLFCGQHIEGTMAKTCHDKLASRLHEQTPLQTY